MTIKDETPPQAAKPRRGFASMDPQRLRDISSKGGSAPNRSPARGFALMDEARRREVSLKGLQARRSLVPAQPVDDTGNATVPSPVSGLADPGGD